MLLEVKDIRVNYDRVEALKGISFSVEAGTIVTLIGANGAGKTTTMMTISGLKSPSAGEIWFEGERIDGAPSQDIIRKGITQVPEGRRIFPRLSVLDNLRVGSYVRKDKEALRQDMDRVFERFPILRERRSQPGGSLSGGEQQMLAVARALMTRPKLLLMDEPTLGLSPLMVQEISRIITEINQQGVTIVLVEQNSRLALSLAQKAYVLETGNITLEGLSRDLVDNEHVRKAYLGA